MLTKAQTRKLQYLTAAIERYHKIFKDGVMSYRLTVLECGAVNFVATNIYGGEGGTNGGCLRWYESPRNFFAIIGVRGGCRQYEGNIKL